MYDKFAVLSLMVVVVVSVSLGMKEDVAHGTPVKHGMKHGGQDSLKKDGSWNVHFDHAAIIRDKKLEEEFDEMEPKEAKYRLSLLIKKMDKDEDGFVSKEELTDWILMSFRLLDEEEAVEEMNELDKNLDKKIHWPEFLQAHFSYNEDELKEFRYKNNKENEELMRQVDEEEKKFAAADLDNNGYLDSTEFTAFYHPHSFEHMHKFELDRTMFEHDKNKDGKLSLEEFLEEAGGDKEWIAIEKDRFNKDYDKNGDGYLDYDEIRAWVLTDNKEEAREEAEHLIEEADENHDGKLSDEEFLENVETFVGSSATDYGRHLHFVKHRDEL